MVRLENMYTIGSGLFLLVFFLVIIVLLDGLMSTCFRLFFLFLGILNLSNRYFSNLDRVVLRIFKKSSLSRSESESSFHSCTDDVENVEDDLEDEYTWKSPAVFINNILFGRLWSEFQGDVNLQHTQSNQKAVLTIKAHSWFATQATKTAEMFKYSGFIYDGISKYFFDYSFILFIFLGTTKLAAFHGNYGHCYYAIDNLSDADLKSSSICSAGGNNCIHINTNSFVPPVCDIVLTPSSRLIWHRCFPTTTDDELTLRPQYYFFTPFAMSLNEPIIPSETSLLLPPTDCRFRQDIRYLENGELDNAANEKHRLEEQQRAEAKKREGEFQPLWFKKNDKNEYIYTGDYEQRKFDHCPNLFSQPSTL